MKYLSILVALLLTGCATVNQNSELPQWGDLVSTPIANTGEIVGQTVEEISRIWPPAKTGFSLPTSFGVGEFGDKLTDALRQAGYRLNEGGGDTTSSELNYLLDRGADDIYRLMITVGDESMTRAYEGVNGSLLPIGHWAKKGG